MTYLRKNIRPLTPHPKPHYVMTINRDLVRALQYYLENGDGETTRMKAKEALEKAKP